MEKKHQSNTHNETHLDRRVKRDGYYPTDNTNTARQIEYDYAPTASQAEERIKRDRISAQKKRQQKMQRRYRMRMRALVTTLIIITAFGGVAVKAAHVHLVKANQVSVIEDEIKKLQLENDGLKRNVDLLGSVKHIEEAAIAMGMEKPGGKIVVSNSHLNTKSEVDNQALSSSGSSDKTGQTSANDQVQPAEEKSFLAKVLGALITVIANQ